MLHSKFQDYIKQLPHHKHVDETLSVESEGIVWSLSATFIKHGDACAISDICCQEEYAGMGMPCHYVIQGRDKIVYYNVGTDTIFLDLMLIDKYGDNYDQPFSQFIENIFDQVPPVVHIS